MSKARQVRAEWLESLSEEGVSIGARFLYVGALSLADDEGLLLWSPEVVVEALYSRDAGVGVETVAGWMGELQSCGLVVSYTAGRAVDTYGWLPGFVREQTIKKKSRSRLPAPCVFDAAVRALYGRRDAFMCHVCRGPVPATEAAEPTGPAAHIVDAGAAATAERDALGPVGDSPAVLAAAGHLSAPEGVDGTSVAPAGDALAGEVIAVLDVVVERTSGASGVGGFSAGSWYPSEVATAHLGCARRPLPLTATAAGLVSSGLVSSSTGAGVGAMVEEAAGGHGEGAPAGGGGAAPGGAGGAVPGAMEVVVEAVAGHGQQAVGGARTGAVGGAVQGVPVGGSPLVPVGGVPLATGEVSEGVAPSLPESYRNVPVVVPEAPLTCANVEFSGAIGGEKGDSGRTPVVLPDLSGGERKGKEGNRERSLGAARPTAPSVTTFLDPTSFSACGAGQDEASSSGDVSGAAGSVGEKQAPRPAVTQPMSSETPRSVTTVHDQHDPEAPMPHVTDEDQDSLFAVPQEMFAPETKKAKRKDPATWTADRKEIAHEILGPWWSIHGDGWAQRYGVVFGVIIAALAQKVPRADVEAALAILGPERKPISGGTIQFALARGASGKITTPADLSKLKTDADYVDRTM